MVVNVTESKDPLFKEQFTDHRNKEELVECMERYVNYRMAYHKDTDIVKTVVSLAVDKFYHNDDFFIGIKSEVMDIIEELKASEKYRDENIPWNHLKRLVVEAVEEECFGRRRDPYREGIDVYVELPEFDSEPLDLANVLDFASVEWDEPLESMIQTRDDRATLRRYADQAQMTLALALSLYDHDYFKVALRALWMRRAQLYFDFHSSRSYIRHHYFDSEISTPDNIHDEFSARSGQNFEARNPPASPEELERVLNTHIPEQRPGYSGEYDIYAEYQRSGMSRAEYYFEERINRFYQTIFFFQELQARNIAIDEDDNYDGPLPLSIVPAEIHSIFTDSGYRDYLIRKRQSLENMNAPRNLNLQYLIRTARVYDEDLVELMFTEGPNNHFSNTNTSGSSLFTISGSSNDRIRVPKFDNETPELASILDLILINWSIESRLALGQMERSLLRKFADRAQTLLASALSSYSSKDFRAELRKMWNRRAKLYYDANSTTPYIPYFLSPEEVTPYTDRDINAFSLRSSRNWEDRNPRVSAEDINRILNIHVAENRSGYDGESDIYAEYQRNGMSSAEYYFETHMDQFWRIFFYIQELRERGISTDEDDDYVGALPLFIVPAEVQAILYSDGAYRRYLSRRRSSEESDISENPNRRNLAKSARVHVEDLVLLTINTQNTESASTTTRSTNTTASTTSTTSTTPKYQPQEDRHQSRIRITDKGILYRNGKGKNFIINRSGPMFPDSCCKNSYGKMINDLDKFTESCFQRFNYKVTSSEDKVFVLCSMIQANRREKELSKISNIDGYFGYVTSNCGPNDEASNQHGGFILHTEDLNQLLLPEDETSSIMKMLSGFYSPVDESADQLAQR